MVFKSHAPACCVSSEIICEGKYTVYNSSQALVLIFGDAVRALYRRLS